MAEPSTIEMGTGEVSGFRLIEEREANWNLAITAPPCHLFGRTLFGAYLIFLVQRDVDVTQYQYFINKHALNATVIKRIRDGKICSDECGRKPHS
jgi:hypothetical protein